MTFEEEIAAGIFVACYCLLCGAENPIKVPPLGPPKCCGGVPKSFYLRLGGTVDG